MAAKKITTPLTDEVVRDLRAGDEVEITGVVYQARDAAHKRIVALIEADEPLPFDLQGAVVYYMGPSPAGPGKVIGSAGPTTSGRMDAYAPTLMAHGLKGMIGKGLRTPEVKAAMRAHTAVYFAATGGAGALLAQRIVGNETIAWPELGAEAVARLEVRDFPAIVVNDCHGADLYEEGRRKYARSRNGLYVIDRSVGCVTMASKLGSGCQPGGSHLIVEEPRT
jgi:fumarate hydratase subunit beta